LKFINVRGDEIGVFLGTAKEEIKLIGL
jgi:hypothetical protein